MNKNDKIINIINILISQANKTNIDNYNIQEIREENIFITLTSTYNQKYNENKNKTTIDFGKCENILKKEYNISYNDSLYVIKLDIEDNSTKIPIIEYEVYYPLFNEIFQKLNLTLYKDTKTEISIPVELDDDIDKHNYSSDYYNSICSKATSKSGTDIVISDRINEFVDNDMTFCEEDCDLIDYDYNNEKAKCSCPTKIKLPFIDNIKFDKNKLFKRFTHIKRFINLGVMKCYKNIFDKDSFKNNYGFMIILLINVFYLVSLILFIYHYFILLRNEINNIVITIKTFKNNKKLNSFYFKRNLMKLDVINIKQLNTVYISHAMNQNEIINSNNKTDKTNTIMLDTEDENIPKVLEYGDYELNKLNYEDALKLDKRSFINHYIGFIKMNHLLIFTFFVQNDYNSRIIKIFLFFFFFCCTFNC